MSELASARLVAARPATSYRRRDAAANMLILACLGCGASDLLYVFGTWAVWSGLNETTKLERAMHTGWMFALGTLHVVCWIMAAYNHTRERPRRDLFWVMVALAGTWFICGGWLSPLFAVFAVTTGLEPKAPVGIRDVGMALIALIPLLSIAATCFAGWLSLGTRGTARKA